MIVLLTILSMLAHDFHVSETEINLDQESQTLQITTHLFIDDLEADLKIDGHEGLHLGTPDEVAATDSLLQVYFDEFLNISVDGKPVQCNLLGKEMSKDLIATYCYLEVEGVTSLEELGITSSVLLRLYDDQKNIITVLENNKTVDFQLLREGNESMTTKF